MLTAYKKNICKHYFNQSFLLWIKAFDFLYFNLENKRGLMCPRNDKSDIEQKKLFSAFHNFLDPLKERSPKIIMMVTKPLFLTAQKIIQSLSNLETNLNQAISDFYQMKQRLLPYAEHNAELQKLKEAIEEANKSCEHTKTKLYKDPRSSQNISSFIFFNELVSEFFVEKPKQDIAKEQIAFIKKSQRELIEEEEKYISSLQKNTQASSPVESSCNEIEELLELQKKSPFQTLLRAPNQAQLLVHPGRIYRLFS